MHFFGRCKETEPTKAHMRQKNMATEKALVIALFLFAIAKSCQTPSSQTAALIDLYNSANGPNWTNHKNWGIGDPCTNGWNGITCNTSCQVTQIFLVSNGLYGTIPSTMSNLVGLIYLRLQQNKLFGTVPSSLGSITGLQILDLSVNQMTGTVPSTLGNFKYMAYLYLYLNKFTGIIPSQFGNLGSLKELDMRQNQLVGSIPDSLGNTPLIKLHLQQNQLNGTVPQFLQVPWPNAQTNFNISYNNFSCPLPQWCSSSPTGDGLCAPCVNVTTKQICCLYSDSPSCSQLYGSICSVSSCPALPGQQLCGQFQTNDCNQCVLPSSKKRISFVD